MNHHMRHGSQFASTWLRAGANTAGRGPDGSLLRHRVIPSRSWQVQLADGTKIGRPDPDFDEEILDERRERLSHLHLGEQFVYVFDFGDYWAHLCTVAQEGVDPLEVLGLVPREPIPYFGWGSIPDQYGRAWDEDDSSSPPPPDPELRDLPPLQPGWGPRAQDA